MVVEDADKPNLGNLLSAYQSKLADAYAEAHAEIESNSPAADRLEQWVELQPGRGLEVDLEDSTVRKYAEQCGYVTVNRTVFYTYLRKTDRIDLSPLPTAVQEDAGDLENLFSSAAEQSEYTRVFHPSTAFDGLPATDRVTSLVTDLANKLEQYPLDTLDGEVIGEVYQQFISSDEKRSHGQFYTPRQIADTLATWAITSPDDRVLDPCCGSGIITEACHRRLIKNGCPTGDAVAQIQAVDINPLAVQMTALMMAIKSDGGADEMSVRHSDFFDVGTRELGDIDAVVANPPYVRQEKLQEDKQHYREHLAAFGRNGETPYLDGEKSIDGRADMYCYFLTHATEFLPDGGRLAWVVPTKWMVAEYGESVKQFIYDHFAVEAVISFDGRLFSDALVDTVLLLLQRESNPNERDSTDVPFIRITEQKSVSDVLRLVDDAPNLTDDEYIRLSTGDNHRSITVAQWYLQETPEMNLNRFLTSPAFYTRIVEHPRTVSMDEFWDVRYGAKTGSNELFLLSAEEVQKWDIDKRVLTPAVKSIRDITGLTHTTEEADRYLVSVSDQLSPVGSDREDVSDPIDRLEQEGFDGLAAYLRHMESHPDRSNPSVQSNTPWFNLGDLPTADVLLPLAMDNRRDVIRTEGHIVPLNRFAIVHADDPELALGILNSNYMKVVFESRGRVTGGGAVNYAVSDISEMPVPDLRQMEEAQHEAIRSSYGDLLDGESGAIAEIDATIIDFLDLDTTPAEVEELADELMQARRGDTAGELPDIIDGIDTRFTVGRGQQRLDSFID